MSEEISGSLALPSVSSAGPLHRRDRHRPRHRTISLGVDPSASFSSTESSGGDGGSGSGSRGIDIPQPKQLGSRKSPLLGGGGSALCSSPAAAAAPLPPSPGFKEFVHLASAGEGGGGGPAGSGAISSSALYTHSLPYGMGTPSAKAIDGAARAVRGGGGGGMQVHAAHLAAEVAAASAMAATPEDEEEDGEDGVGGAAHGLGAEVEPDFADFLPVAPYPAAAGPPTLLGRPPAPLHGSMAQAPPATARPPVYPSSRMRPPASASSLGRSQREPFLMSTRACLAEGWDVVDEDEAVLSPAARARLTGGCAGLRGGDKGPRPFMRNSRPPPSHMHALKSTSRPPVFLLLTVALHLPTLSPPDPKLHLCQPSHTSTPLFPHFPPRPQAAPVPALPAAQGRDATRSGLGLRAGGAPVCVICVPPSALGHDLGRPCRRVGEGSCALHRVDLGRASRRVREGSCELHKVDLGRVAAICMRDLDAPPLQARV